jgi:CheY-like chemotaxis protein
MADPTGTVTTVEYDIPCAACGAGCRSIDRFCSQCGHRDPTGRFAPDDLLTAPTMIATPDEPIDAFPQMKPTFITRSESLDLIVDDDSTDEKPVIPTIVLPADSPNTPPPVRRRTREQRAQKQAERSAALEKMLVPGNTFGRRYRIQKFLGAGAMGYVCSATDESIDETVALKILSAPVEDDPDAYERFKTELKLARRIRHRNVVQSFDLGFAEGFPYISMEYIDADNLLKHLGRRTAFEELPALTIMRQVLRGLRAAHDLGIIHRDIKPENILLNKHDMAFITDFGIATTADRVRRSEIAGTPDYMAPEQLRSEDVSPASDFYACGIVLYRLLTGALPFTVTSVHEMIEAHLHHEPAPLPDDLEVTAGTRELIEWMLQKKMAERPQHANAIIERIDAALTRETSSASKRITILVAEQDPETLTFVRTTLEGEGYKVIATTTADEAVNAAFQQSPSVILLDASIRGVNDIILPDADTTPGLIPIGGGAEGLGVCRLLRGDEKLARVPILVLSNPEQSALKPAYSQCGAAEFLLKPLAAPEITAAVRRHQIAVF